MGHGTRPWNANTPPQTLYLELTGAADTVSGTARVRIPRAAQVTSVYLLTDTTVNAGDENDNWTVALMSNDDVLATISNETADISADEPNSIDPTLSELAEGDVLSVVATAVGIPANLSAVNFTYVLEYEHV